MPKGDQFVYMVHKDFPEREPTKVLASVFEGVWKDKGWKKVEPKARTGIPAPTPPSTPSSSGGQSDN